MLVKNKRKVNPLVVILGPTSSGKSELAVKLAKDFNGEVISADSRQVYKGMDIGTGKITKKEMQGVPHHLLSVVSPKTRFSVVQYRKLALRAIKEIQKKKRLPFLVGGTGFYIQAVVDGIVIPEVKPDWALRKELEKNDTSQLYKLLKNLDPRRARTIETKNRRRLIRALEIVMKTGNPVPRLQRKPHPFPVLLIGIKKAMPELRERIKRRLQERLKQGMIKEVKRLKNSGLSWQRLEDFGLEYRYVSLYLQKKLGYEQMREQLQKAIEQYAKRQMTWFKKDKTIRWIDGYRDAEKLVKTFLK